MSSIKAQARWAGVIYVVMSLLGISALLYLPRLFVAGDPAATAANIMSHEPTYRLILFGSLLGSILFVVLGWSLYHLFEAVDRKQAMLLLVLVVTSAVIGIIDVALLATPLVFSSGAAFLAAIPRPELDALSLGFLQVREFELHANIALWGLWLIPFGVLVIKSRFIPPVIGWLLFVACAGYLALSFGFIVLPAYAHAIGRVAGVMIQAELPVILWLVIMGAKAPAPR